MKKITYKTMHDEFFGQSPSIKITLQKEISMEELFQNFKERILEEVYADLKSGEIKDAMKISAGC